MNLLQRAAGVFYAPDRVFSWLAENPRWVGAFVLSAALGALAQYLIPLEMQMQAMRAFYIERGMEASDADIERFARMGRLFAPVTTIVFTLVLTLLIAGAATFVFAFLMGDAGHFKQYLAATAHSLIIPMVGTVAITPLRIMSGDPQLLISPGSMLGSAAGDGFVGDFLRYIDLFQVWGMAVLAIGIARIDPKRDFATAFAVLFGLQLTIAAILALLI